MSFRLLLVFGALLVLECPIRGQKKMPDILCALECQMVEFNDFSRKDARRVLSKSRIPSPYTPCPLHVQAKLDPYPSKAIS
jgi:hypothetical protein